MRSHWRAAVLHEKATNRPKPQPGHRVRMNPHASTPHGRNASNSATTCLSSACPSSCICSAKAAK